MSSEKPQLFTTQNIVMGILLSGMAFGISNIVSGNTAIAQLQGSQKENDRVNQIVYGMESTLINLNHTTKELNTRVESIDKSLRRREAGEALLRLEVHCLSTTTDQISFKKCVEDGKEIIARQLAKG